jgi:hypothetical protein
MFADSMPMPVADKYPQLPLAQAAPPTVRSKIVAHFFFSHVSDFGKDFYDLWLNISIRPFSF